MSTQSRSVSPSWGVIGVGDEVIVFVLVVAVVLFPLVVAFVRSVFKSANENPNANGRMNPDSSAPEGRVRTTDFDCPICLDQVRLSVEFNCGHGYCGQCVISLIATNPVLNIPFQDPRCSICPYCRQRVTLILPYFSESERSSADPELSLARNVIIEKLGEYNRKVSGAPRSLAEQLRDLPVLASHLWTWLFSENGLHTLFGLRIFVYFLATAIYIVSPFDFVSESVFGIYGLADDLSLLFLMIFYLPELFRRFVARE